LSLQKRVEDSVCAAPGHLESRHDAIFDLNVGLWNAMGAAFTCVAGDGV
jgi:hypothetical protein